MLPVRGEGRGQATLTPSCAVPVAPGMVVHTNTRRGARVAQDGARAPAVRPRRRLRRPLHDRLPGAVRHPRVPRAGRRRRRGPGGGRWPSDFLTLPAALGRVCPRLCEQRCHRCDAGDAVSIGSLHRFAADADLASGVAVRAAPGAGDRQARGDRRRRAGRAHRRVPPAARRARRDRPRRPRRARGHAPLRHPGVPAAAGRAGEGDRRHRGARRPVPDEDAARARRHPRDASPRVGRRLPRHRRPGVARPRLPGRGAGPAGRRDARGGRRRAAASRSATACSSSAAATPRWTSPARRCGWARRSRSSTGGRAARCRASWRKWRPPKRRACGSSSWSRRCGLERTDAGLRLTCQRMALGEPDLQGRPRPVPVAGSEFTLEATAVVSAVGQVVEAQDVWRRPGCG